MFLAGHDVRKTRIMPRQAGNAGVGQALVALPLRPRHPLALSNKGKPFARNDPVFVTAVAAHLHALLPGIVGIDNEIEDELQEPRGALPAAAKGLIEVRADEGQLADFDRGSGAMAFTIEFQIWRVVFKSATFKPDADLPKTF
jgi:hypothetical protein